MSEELLVKSPIIGKTYSLYGGDLSSDGFYETISSVTDIVEKEFNRSTDELLSFITFAGSSRGRIKSTIRKDDFFAFTMQVLHENLVKYLINIDEHLKSITFRQRWDSRLSTSENQYLLYLLEIELTNRIYKNKFIKSINKFAFLPHCLKDFSRECLSAPDEIDYLCRRCSKICTVNKVSQILKEHNIIPYIWMQADLGKIFKVYKDKSETIGVIGIACIPELANGMHLCRKYNIPVVGIPLDANRCRRWMGDFYENSVNIKQLEKLVFDSSKLKVQSQK